MAVTGTILALDLATRMGWASGRPGEQPRSGSVRLMKPGAAQSEALREFGCWLRDRFMVDKPELVIFEAPLPIGSLADVKDDGTIGYRSNPKTIALLNGLAAGVDVICGPYGIRTASGHVQTVRKHFLGQARPAEPKAAVIARCHLLKLMPADCYDDNRGDALALHDFAMATYGRRAPSELVMFGGRA